MSRCLSVEFGTIPEMGDRSHFATRNEAQACEKIKLPLHQVPLGLLARCSLAEMVFILSLSPFEKLRTDCL